MQCETCVLKYIFSTKIVSKISYHGNENSTQRQMIDVALATYDALQCRRSSDVLTICEEVFFLFFRAKVTYFSVPINAWARETK